jgi:hypothetical protein
MAGIGEDIKEVIEELGTSVYISRPNGVNFLEKIDMVEYPNSSTEFIRQNFATFTLVHDTRIVAGDIVEVKTVPYIATRITPSYFEDELVDITATLYRCNVTGTLQRLTETRNPTTYVTVPTWTAQYTGVRALQHEGRLGNALVMQNDIMALSDFAHSLFIPNYITVIVGDRWYPFGVSVAEYYRVTKIERKRLDGVWICELQEDTRL